MSAAEAIREAIAARLEAVPDIGIVHRYERYANQAGALAKHYQWQNQLRGWFVRRVAVAETPTSQLGGTRIEDTTWMIRGYMALSDEAQSELVFDGLIEALRDAFRDDDTLGGTVASCWVRNGPAGVQMDDAGPVLFGGVLCHSARLRLVTRRYF
jgi:hypothetical protein